MSTKEKALMGVCAHPSCAIPVVTYPGQLLRKWCGKHRRARAARLARLKQLGGRDKAVLRSPSGRSGDNHALPL